MLSRSYCTCTTTAGRTQPAAGVVTLPAVTTSAPQPDPRHQSLAFLSQESRESEWVIEHEGIIHRSWMVGYPIYVVRPCTAGWTCPQGVPGAWKRAWNADSESETSTVRYKQIIYSSASPQSCLTFQCPKCILIQVKVIFVNLINWAATTLLWKSIYFHTLQIQKCHHSFSKTNITLQIRFFFSKARSAII